MPVCFIVPPLEDEISTRTVHKVLIVGVDIIKTRLTILAWQQCLAVTHFFFSGHLAKQHNSRAL